MVVQNVRIVDLVCVVKMVEIKEIGVEKEIFLLKNGRIIEPRPYSFPVDDFEFLVEIRSLPSDRFYPVYMTLRAQELQYSLRANKFGLFLDDEPNMLVETKWVDALWKKYNLYEYSDKDYTKNIYDTKKQSHHLGVLDTDFKDTKRLTAGVHVHFSSRDSETGKKIDLPIKDIVRRMDEKFHDIITDERRNIGEFEEKSYGFEYRSLPSNIDVYEVLKEAFKILRSV